MSINKGVTQSGIEIQTKSTVDGELLNRAIRQGLISHTSGQGRSFGWPSLNTDIDAGDTRLFVKNTSDKFLYLSHAVFNPANVACTWNIGLGAATTTPAGTAVTAINLFPQYSNTLESYVAYDDETAVADADILMYVTTETTGTLIVPLEGIILGKNQYIQINQETESTSGQVTLFGHFEKEVI